MIHVLVVLLAVHNIFSYLNVKVAYVGEDGVGDAPDAGTYRKPWRQVVSAISSASKNEPDLLKVLVKAGNYSVATEDSSAVTSKTDFEIIGSVPGEIVTERSKMEDGLTEDTTFDLDCVSSVLSFYNKGEFVTITNNQTFSMRRMRISSSVLNSTIFRIKLGHLIGRKIYFSDVGRKIVIEYIHGSVSLFYCCFLGSKPSYGCITAPNGARNIYLQQCRFNNTIASYDAFSPLYFNNVTNITLQSCVFHKLSALDLNSSGGALHIISPKRVTLIGCSFDQCTAELNGGAMMISNISCADASFIVVSCVFVSNIAKSKWGHQICFHFEWDMCAPTMSGMFKSSPNGMQIYGFYNLGGEGMEYMLSHNDQVGPYNISVNPDGYCNAVDYIDPGVKAPPKPIPRPVDQQTAEASKHLSRILLIFLIIITVVVIVIGILVCIYLVVTTKQGLSKPARVKEKDLNETEAEAYYNQIDGYEIEQVAHDEDGVTIIGEEERVQKGGSKWAKKWALIAKRARKKNKFGVEDVPDEPDGPNPDDLASDVSVAVTKNTKKRSMKKDKSGWSTGYSEYDNYGSQSYSGYGASGYGYSGYSGSNASNGGYSGYSGYGASGYTGSDASGYSGSGASGYSGYSGSGASGYSGSDASGYSGSGASGYSGSGASGYSGSGASGYTGSGSNASGYTGSNASGYTGSNASGYTGSKNSGYTKSNPSGYSSASGASGYTDAGYSGSNPPSGYSNSNPSGYSSGSGASGYTDAGYSGSGASGYSDASGSGVHSDYSNASGAGASGYSKASKASSKSKRSSSSHRSDAPSKKSKASKATKSKK